MEAKNQKLSIIVGALLVVIGVLFSYFLATTLINGNGVSIVGTTAVISGATLRTLGFFFFFLSYILMVVSHEFEIDT